MVAKFCLCLYRNSITVLFNSKAVMALLPPGCVWTWQTQPNRGVAPPDTVSKNVKKPLGLMVGTATPTASVSHLRHNQPRNKRRDGLRCPNLQGNMCGFYGMSYLLPCVAMMSARLGQVVAFCCMAVGEGNNGAVDREPSSTCRAWFLSPRQNHASPLPQALLVIGLCRTH